MSSFSSFSHCFLASDHAGYEVKQALVKWIKSNQSRLCLSEVIDLGCSDLSSVDYPDFAHLLSRKVIEGGQQSMGIAICGSGLGMSMACNRHFGVRAALCHREEYVLLARQHNNANILCLGARFGDHKDFCHWVELFISTAFEGGRHQRRVSSLDSFNS